MLIALGIGSTIAEIIGKVLVPEGGARARLLGVLYAGPLWTAEGKIKVVNVPTRMEGVPVTDIPINLGCVVKAERLLDFEPIFEATGRTARRTRPAQPS